MYIYVTGSKEGFEPENKCLLVVAAGLPMCKKIQNDNLTSPKRASSVNLHEQVED